LDERQPSLAGALDALWAKFLPEMEERVATLETASAAFSQSSLSEDEQEAASSAAHKLAGVLGTFGLTRGTELARELESMFSRRSDRDSALGERMSEIAAQLRTIVATRK
jgi:HPt (histidine-containing phosphotransfer) domain-containing protein